MQGEPLYTPEWTPRHMREAATLAESIDNYIAALTDAEFEELVARTRPGAH